MAPGIPNEKSRTVRPVHGPATVHLLLQVYGLPIREASGLSLGYTTVVPAGRRGDGFLFLAGEVDFWGRLKEEWGSPENQPDKQKELCNPADNVLDSLSALLVHHLKGRLLTFGDISPSSQNTGAYAPTFMLI